MRYMAFVITFFLVGCGYKPVSKISQNLLDDRVYVDVIINKVEPKNSIFIKDAVREGIVLRLNKKLTDKESANTKIIVSTKSLTYTPLIYDKYGYISAYRANLALNFKVNFKDGSTQDLPVLGEYNFSVSRKAKSSSYADSIISDTEKYEAIKEASKEAFDEFISKLAIKGYKNGSN